MCYQLLVQVPESDERFVLEAIYTQSGLRTVAATLNGLSALCLSKEGSCSCSLVSEESLPFENPALASSSYESVAQALAAACQVSPTLNFAFRWTDGFDADLQCTESMELAQFIEQIRSGSIRSNMVYRIAREH